MLRKLIYISGIISIFAVFYAPLFAESENPIPDCIFADLAITAAEVPDPVDAGQNLTYQITATNNGPQTAQNPVITVVLPNETQFESSTVPCNASAGTVTCMLASMGNGTSVAIDLIVKIDPAASGYITSAMAIQNMDADAIDPNPGNNNLNLDTFVLGPVLAISINDVEIVEPESGTANAVFTVTLSETSTFEVRVDYATANGTASSGEDFMETHGTLVFPPNTTELQIQVPVLPDAIMMEGDETFYVNLTSPVFAVIFDAQGVGLISETCLFCDHFDDNILRTDWTYSKPCWTESDHMLVGSPCSGRRTNAVANPAFEGLTGAGLVQASLMTSGGPGNRLWLLAWFTDKKNTVEVIMKEELNAWVLKQKSGGKVVAKKKVKYPIDPNVDYDVKVYCDGYSIKFYVNDELLTELTYGANVSGTVGFKTKDTVGKFCVFRSNQASVPG